MMLRCSHCGRKVEHVFPFGRKKICYNCVQLEVLYKELGFESKLSKEMLDSNPQERGVGRRFVYKRFSDPKKRGLHKVRKRELGTD